MLLCSAKIGELKPLCFKNLTWESAWLRIPRQNHHLRFADGWQKWQDGNAIADCASKAVLFFRITIQMK